MKSLHKNHTLEALLAKRVPFNELTPELYIEAKESKITDLKIIELCGTYPKALNDFKHANGLIGKTVPGYEHVTYSRQSNKSVNQDKEQEDAVVIEGTRGQSVLTPDNMELHIQIKTLQVNLDGLKKTLEEKDDKISRLNAKTTQMQDDLEQCSRLIRALELENEQLRHCDNDYTIAFEEDRRVLSEDIQAYKDIVKKLATLI